MEFSFALFENRFQYIRCLLIGKLQLYLETLHPDKSSSSSSSILLVVLSVDVLSSSKSEELK